MSKRAELKEKRRQELLDLSLELFVYKGYDGTTVRDIAEKANISVGLLFHYFPTKQAILEELIQIAQSGITSIADLLLSARDPLEGFEQITKVLLESFAESTTKNLFLLVIQIKTFKSIPDIAGQIQSFPETIKAIVQAIMKGQQMGEIKKGDPLSLALAYWGAIQGIAELLVWFPDFSIPEYQWLVDILREEKFLQEIT